SQRQLTEISNYILKEEDQSKMAKKVKKKPSKKTKTKGAAKPKKGAAKPKKAAAPKKKAKVAAKKTAAPRKKAAAPKKKAVAPAKKAAVPEKKSAPKSAKTTKSFSVTQFANMTYLTENGVMEWLQKGLLKGQQDAKGNWQVDASNLEAPNIKRFVR
ncbi:MAG: hypothetical protein PVH94_17935, partial [Desulfobacterales bacterium]